MRPRQFLFLVILVITSFLTLAQDRGGTPKANTEESDLGNTYAMIFGISNYPSITPLKYADKDAELFKQFLQSPAGGNIKDDNIFFKINENAKAAIIFQYGMGWLKTKNLKRGDHLYFYF